MSERELLRNEAEHERMCEALALLKDAAALLHESTRTPHEYRDEARYALQHCHEAANWLVAGAGCEVIEHAEGNGADVDVMAIAEQVAIMMAAKNASQR